MRYYLSKLGGSYNSLLIQGVVVVMSNYSGQLMWKKNGFRIVEYLEILCNQVANYADSTTGEASASVLAALVSTASVIIG